MRTHRNQCKEYSFTVIDTAIDKFARTFQVVSEIHQSEPVEDAVDMSFTLDHNDIDQTNDDTDSLYIVISDEPLHQSRPVQLLTKDKLTPPYTLSS
ncbi:unnamed protein product [Rhizophagus irregularis]|nr:unnamed protein product [Rhizophagus irregularis]